MSKVDCKVVLLGQHNVGKTCLVYRFLHDIFHEKTSTTVGAAFGAKRITIDGHNITLGIWDTAGSERYESMSKMYYRSAKAALVCFDLTNRESFLKAKFWTEELKQNEEGCAVYLVGTKLDLVEDQPQLRAVEKAEVLAYAESVGAVEVFETSAKKNKHVEDVFTKVATVWLETQKSKPIQPFNPPQTVDVTQSQTQTQSSGCCS